jgi:UDP-2,4-diacetamido-2,4,6-trideoxy-beta-L-altropyranose hydrolase
MDGTLLFRADADADIGSGHVMRCLALAQHASDVGMRPILLTTTPDGPAVAAWRGEGYQVRSQPPETAIASAADAAATSACAREVAADWIVLDGYRFDAAFQARLADERRLLVFDDVGETDVATHVLVNQNPGAEQWARYRAPAGCRQLLGSSFAVLRRDLRILQRQTPKSPSRLLITFGGADRENLALRVMERLGECVGQFCAVAICSAGDEGLADAQAFARGHGDRFRIVAPGPIHELLAEADVVICAGGTTSLECAALGIPSVLVVTADNQRRGAMTMASAGAAHLAGEGGQAIDKVALLAKRLLDDASERAEISRAGQKLVSRDGVTRVVQTMCELA